MLPEVKAIEPALKQVLYHCLEHVQATKAALYLSASHDLNTKRYEIATSYQFTVSDRGSLGANDDLVDRLVVKRGAFFVNGLGSDQRFAEMLFRQGTDRLLAMPLFSRGRLVGFIDMRDKAGKKPFEPSDVDSATKIGQQMLDVLAKHSLFGIGAIQLVEEPAHSARSSAPAIAAASPAAAAPAERSERGPLFSAAATHAIEAARQHFARRQLAQTRETREATNADLEQLNLLLPSILATPGATIACFTGNAQSGATLAAALGAPDEETVNMLQEHMRKSARGSTHSSTARARLQFIQPFGAQLPAIQSASVSAIVTTAVLPQTVEGLFLTVAFTEVGHEQGRQMVDRFLQQLEPLIRSSLGVMAALPDRQLLADRLLEPDFEKYPALVEHSRTVSAIAHRFALELGLGQAEAENVRLAALVHDVGLRLLDYERLYTRGHITAEELKGLTEHPVIGAALVEPLLGQEVAQAVLRHHERVDGKGYPSRLSGNQIPLASRIIQIADAWVAMTRQTYQPAIGADEAAVRLRDAAGTQFDAALVERFLGARDTLLS
jgi:hypothetical protein